MSEREDGENANKELKSDAVFWRGEGTKDKLR